MSFPGPFSHVESRDHVDVDGHPMVITYGDGRPSSEPPPSDRGYARKETRERKMFELRTEFHKDGTITSPDFPKYKPTRATHGGMVVTRMMRCIYDDHASEMYVEVKCPCGFLSAIQASNWRGTPPRQCRHCARGSIAKFRFGAGYYCVDKWPVKR